MLRSMSFVALICLGSPALAAPFTADCILRPSTTVRVGTPVSGILAEVLVDRGDQVNAGDVIARLDVTLQDMAIRSAQARIESNAEVEAAEARVVMLTAQRDRNKALLDRNVVSAAQLEEAETELQVAQNEVLIAQQNRLIAEVDLEQAQAERSRRHIRSPIDGFVIERALSAGEFWSEDTPLVTLANVELLHVEAIVGIEHYEAVAAGDSAIVVPEAPLGGQYQARVAVIDPVFDAASGTFGVRLDLPNPEFAVPAGLRCQVTFGENVAEQDP